MGTSNRRGRSAGCVATTGAAMVGLLVSACSAPTPKVGLRESGTKEYFAEAEYGVKASPRVSWKPSGLQRGGGRYHVGKPYKIKNRWYRPKEDPDYVAEGAASWYGEAFHGRLTANGEVYDMTHLTAAHPTMPLPSYARVTNLENGSSVIVRVNDRGPFAHSRVIDLSKRAAEVLDYRDDGVARVRVEYVGPAPLHGQDDGFLMASYRPGHGAPDPSDGLPSGVMLAMDKPMPSEPVRDLATAFTAQPARTEAAAAVDLPTVGPTVPDRPRGLPAFPAGQELALLSYADQRVRAASQPFETVLNRARDGDSLADARDGQERADEGSGSYINLGTWASYEDAERMNDMLSHFGRVDIEPVLGEGRQLHVLSLIPHREADLDTALRAAWAAGAMDAFAVRD